MIEYTPKSIDFELINKFPALKLEMFDKYGEQYLDGSIVECIFKDARMIGYVRYACGRFEIVCPFKDKRVVLGLNNEHKIIGHWYYDKDTVQEQQSLINSPI